MPPLPFSTEAISFCFNMCAIYAAARWLTLCNGNALAAAVACSIFTVNVGLMIYNVCAWFSLR